MEYSEKPVKRHWFIEEDDGLASLAVSNNTERNPLIYSAFIHHNSSNMQSRKNKSTRVISTP